MPARGRLPNSCGRDERNENEEKRMRMIVEAPQAKLETPLPRSPGPPPNRVGQPERLSVHGAENTMGTRSAPACPWLPSEPSIRLTAGPQSGFE